MDYFLSEGLQLAYRVEGEGRPILLIHGFASSHRVNWVSTGWKDALVQAGYRVILPDGRGHGASDKPHDPAAYTLAAMAGDAVCLLDHLDVPQADVMGYSMGGMVTLVALAGQGERFGKAVVAGVGAHLLRKSRDPRPVIEALLAEDPDSITDTEALLFRRFADQNGQDREALAACFGAVRADFPQDLLSQIENPVLVVAGETDKSAGDPEPLAARIRGGSSCVVPRRDHMKTVGDRAYKEAALQFFG